MKIAVVGCGALGSFYGARLGRGGQEVHFLLRTDYETVKSNGVSIKSPEGDFEFHPKCALKPDEIGICDLVVIALKTTANHRYRDLLPPLVGEKTAILTLQNGLGNESALEKLFPKEQIMGGLCFVCLNRLKPGLIEHIAHGKIVLGEYERPPLPRTQEIATMLERSGTPCKVADSLERAHWEKLIWNIPFNGLGVAATAGYEACITGELPPRSHRATQAVTTDRLLNDPNWTQLVRDLMNEVIHTANSLDLKVDPALAERNIEETKEMGAYRASTLVDFERGHPLELDSIFLTPLRIAKQHKIETPRLELLCRVLQQLQPIAAAKRRPSNPAD